MESGSLRQLRHLSRTRVDAVIADVPAGLHDIVGVHDLEVEGQRVTCEVSDDGIGALMSALSDAGLLSLTSQQPTLEEVFLKHYQDGPADD